MALAATGVFEVQGDAGSDLYAGYYNPAATGAGTDLTYPASSPVSITDLQIHATDATKVKSSSVACSAVGNGNGLNITGGTGFTLGLFEIKSNDGTWWALDRACGTAGSTGGTAAAGGALASPGMAAKSMQAKNVSWLNNRSIYDIATVTANSSGGPISLSGMNGDYHSGTEMRGYGSVRGDDGQATIRAGVDNATLLTVLSSAWMRFSNLVLDGNRENFAGASTTAFGGVNWSFITFDNCRFTGSSTAGLALGLNGWKVVKCLFDNNAGTGAKGANYGSVFAFCVARSNDGQGFNATDDAETYVNCISLNNVYGFSAYASANGASRFINCAAYGNAGNGFDSFGSNSNSPFWANCLASSNDGKGFGVYDTSARAERMFYVSNNAAYDNAGGSDVADITLTASPFDDAAIAALTEDSTLEEIFAAFAPNNDPGGGALLRGAGAVPYQDIGAVQHQDAGGGGTGGVKRRPW